MAGVVIWGRANSGNVQKLLWTCEELGVPYERRDAGGKFGVVDTAEYRALNPNGRIPTLVDGDVVLWESNAIIRYLALAHGGVGTLYPEPPAERARVERWLDWKLSTLLPAEQPLFHGMIRTPPEARDEAAIEAAVVACGRLWAFVDAHLGARDHIEGDRLTLADIVLGTFVHRWFGIEGIARPDLPNLRRWYDALHERPSYRRHVAVPLT